MARKPLDMNDVIFEDGALFEGFVWWEVGLTEAVSDYALSDAGPYMVCLSFDKPETASLWAQLLLGESDD